ncbi:hypothetical protein IWX90DRAFT_304613 [Phyllosticta citrichinensis]|uniref:Uncharacterized protein n=1 Tax=Phyllosticta citrichinensis TaxID=1130410 RepID=A0ABR1XLB8_9PEZI
MRGCKARRLTKVFKDYVAVLVAVGAASRLGGGSGRVGLVGARPLLRLGGARLRSGLARGDGARGLRLCCLCRRLRCRRRRRRRRRRLGLLFFVHRLGHASRPTFHQDPSAIVVVPAHNVCRFGDCDLVRLLLLTTAWFSGTAAALRRKCTNLWARSGRARRRSVALVFGKVHMLPDAPTSAAFFCPVLAVLADRLGSVIPVAVVLRGAASAPRVVARDRDYGCFWMAASGDDIDVGGRAAGLEFELQGAGRLFMLSRGVGASVFGDDGGGHVGAEALAKLKVRAKKAECRVMATASSKETVERESTAK